MNAAGSISYEQAGELKIGQVGIANLRVRTLDVEALVQEMRERVERAPKLFGRAAVILDFGGLSNLPDPATARALIAGLREAGVLPVALAYGTHETETLAQQLDLPLLARFRAQYERGEPAAAPGAPARNDIPSREAASRPSARSASREAPRAAPPPVATAQAGLLHRSPVRSGQQVYAEDRDLTVVGMVSPAAEVISDGSIHIYGSLRGRALAGAKGNAEARIFCRDFRAELVAIAGHYKVLEDVPKELLGKPVQVWLENEQLNIALQE